MAIKTRAIGTYTEIYSDKNGGGKSETYITTAKTTMFHEPFRTKLFPPGVSVDLTEWKEITAEQRQTLLDNRVQWKRPPQVFIDLWNEACGIWGSYNEETGFFELNGLTDITYGQAISIYQLGAIESTQCAGRYALWFKNYPNDQCPARTNLPRRVSQALFDAAAIVVNRDFEVVNLNYYLSDDMPFSIWHSSGQQGANWLPDAWVDWGVLCKKVMGVIDVSNINWGFSGTGELGYMSGSALEDIRISGIRGNQCRNLFSMNPNISAASLRFAVENALNTAPMTLRLHSAAYAKVADETNEDYHSLIALAAAKNITFTA